jgi:hypothetical protein
MQVYQFLKKSNVLLNAKMKLFKITILKKLKNMVAKIPKLSPAKKSATLLLMTHPPISPKFKILKNNKN